jgi:hypothetical protein
MTDAWATIIAAVITTIGVVAAASITGKLKWGTFLKSFLIIIVGTGIGMLIGYLLLLKPQPSARIIEPTDGQYVPIYAKVTFEYNNIPRDRHVWLAVRIPGIGLVTWLIYPQLQGMAAIQKSNGVSEITAAFGGDNDSERPFNIVVLLVDEDANLRFDDYANKCKLDSNLCNGMILPDKGVEILDFDTVIRK